MSPPSVLQGGRVRRGVRATQGRRRRYGLIILSALLICLVALLAFMAGRASGPPHARSAAGSKSVVAPVRPAVVRGDYGLALAPAQVRMRLKLPLLSGLLFDVQTGRVLWERDPNMRHPIASLTKMMTALVVAEHSSPNATALITPQAVHFSGSGVGLLPLHKRVLVSTLLYGLMLPSGNDAATALAEHVAGTQDRFVAMMNARGRALGLSCTHFTTVSGIVDQGNYSCAPDLALLAHRVLQQPLLARIVGSSSAILPLPIKGGKLYLYNNNPLYGLLYRGADGVKTGYTTASGQCLVATARRGRAWLGVVLLHSGNTGAQAQQLLNAGFASARG